MPPEATPDLRPLLDLTKEMPLVDERGRQLIAQRNGLGATKSGALTPDDAARMAKVQTNRQARAVLGVVAQVLRQGYQTTVPLYARAVDPGSRELQRTITSGLDGINRYAQKVYAGIPDDDAPVNDLNRRKVALVLAQSRDTVRSIDEAVKDSGLMGVLSSMLDQVLGQAWMQRSPETKRLLIKIGIGVAIVIGALMTLRFVHTVAFGEASGRGRRSRRERSKTPLEEAEEQAAAIMARLRRGRRSR